MTHRSLPKVIAYRKRQQKFIRELKNTPCVDCGGKFHPEAMHFDHLGNKFKNVSLMYTYSKERILEEVNKCEVVCANCHAVRTYLHRTRVVQR